MAQFYKILSKDNTGTEYSSGNTAAAGTYTYLVYPNGEINVAMQFEPSDIGSVLKVYGTLDDPRSASPTYVDLGLPVFLKDSWNTDSLIMGNEFSLSGYLALKLEVVVTGASKYFSLKVKGC